MLETYESSHHQKMDCRTGRLFQKMSLMLTWMINVSTKNRNVVRVISDGYDDSDFSSTLIFSPTLIEH